MNYFPPKRQLERFAWVQTETAFSSKLCCLRSIQPLAPGSSASVFLGAGEAVLGGPGQEGLHLSLCKSQLIPCSKLCITSLIKQVPSACQGTYSAPASKPACSLKILCAKIDGHQPVNPPLIAGGILSPQCPHLNEGQ